MIWAPSKLHDDEIDDGHDDDDEMDDGDDEMDDGDDEMDDGGDDVMMVVMRLRTYVRRGGPLTVMMVRWMKVMMR